MRLQSIRAPAIPAGARFSVRSQVLICIYNYRYCFRPPRPTGNPKAAAAAPHASGAEGVEGNVHASRAWKGNDQRWRQPASARLPFVALLQTVLDSRTHHMDRGSWDFSRLRVSVVKAKTEWSLPTNMAAASTICGYPLPIAATTSAFIAARETMAPHFQRCRLPTTCAWWGSSSVWGSPRSASPAVSRYYAEVWSTWCGSLDR